MVDELLYFDNVKFSTKTIEDVVSNKLSLSLLMKRSSEHLPGNIDDVILQLIYGNSRKPPGDEKSPSQRLMIKSSEEEEDENALIGMWVPPNAFAKAIALKLLFPNLSSPYKLPDGGPPPLYVAVAYDSFKTKDVMELSTQYPGQVLAYGFFTSDIPAETQLIAKTVEEFEGRTTPTTYEEKIVIQLAKTVPECFMAFCELGPTYMSSDVNMGEMDCKIFFPPGYNVPVPEVVEVKKKSKKKGRKHAAAASNQEEVSSVTTSDITTEHNELDHIEDEIEEQESEEEKQEDGETLTGADKATSPLHDEKSQ